MQTFTFEWYSIQTITSTPLVFSLSSTVPLVFALWLMTTKEDRQIMINPGQFRVDHVLLRPSAEASSVALEAERKRMGIDLQ